MLNPQFAMPARPHGIRGFALEGVDYRDFLHDLVRIFAQIAVLDQVGNQRVQAVDGDEFFGEIERRSEVIHAAIDVVRLGDVVVRNRAAETEDAGPGGEDRIPLRRLRASLSTCRNCGPQYPTAPSKLPARPYRAARSSWRSCPCRAARRREAAASIRWCESSRSRPLPPAAPPGTTHPA